MWGQCVSTCSRYRRRVAYHASPALLFCGHSTADLGACIKCPAGQFGSSTSLVSSTCDGPCQGGYYGNSDGMTSDTCVGPCTAGHACPPGSTSPTAVPCAAGYYSLPAASSCTPCPAGVYGATTKLTSASCTAPCKAGSYGLAPVAGFPGSTTDSCSGLCQAGYACAAGSTSPTALQCGLGKYTLAGASVCVDCIAGQFGNVLGNSIAACSGLCQAG